MRDDPIILGLLQNQWVRHPDRVEAILLRRDAAFRRRYLGALLFFGSLTGKRLRAAFGDWCERIVWENASPVITAYPHAHAIPAPDLDHVRRVLADIEPNIVLAFGKNARQAMQDIGWRGVLIRGPHPAARFPDIAIQLASMCRQLKGADNDPT